MYPATVKTVADQLEAKRLSWKGYMEDMGADPVRDGATTCAHPAIGTPDRTQQASAADQYATRHNPFVYFHSDHRSRRLRRARRRAGAAGPRSRERRDDAQPELHHARPLP